MKSIENVLLHVHLEKPIMIPSKQITFLGFIVTQKNVTFTSTRENKTKMLQLC